MLCSNTSDCGTISTCEQSTDMHNGSGLLPSNHQRRTTALNTRGRQGSHVCHSDPCPVNSQHVVTAVTTCLCTGTRLFAWWATAPSPKSSSTRSSSNQQQLSAAGPSSIAAETVAAVAGFAADSEDCSPVGFTLHTNTGHTLCLAASPCDHHVTPLTHLVQPSCCFLCLVDTSKSSCIKQANMQKDSSMTTMSDVQTDL